MAKKKATTRKTSKRAKATKKKPDALLAAVRGATHRYLGHVRLDVGRAGAARVKRMIYPPGFHWAKDMKPVTGTELCMHAHVGFLARGEIQLHCNIGKHDHLFSVGDGSSLVVASRSAIAIRDSVVFVPPDSAAIVRC